MSDENLYNYRESVYSFGFEIPEEEYAEPELNKQQYEHDGVSLISSVVEYVEDENSFVYNIEFEPQNLILLANKMSIVESLRLEQANLFHRKSNVMNMLTKLFENGLCESEVPTKKGTTDEVNEFYENLLMEFRNKKEEWLKQKQIMIEKISKLNEDLNLKSKINSELIDKQYKLELNIAEGIENRKTRKQFSCNEVVKLINQCKIQFDQVNDYHLRYIIEINKCRKLKKDIKYLEESISYNNEYKNELLQKQKFEHLLDKEHKTISKNQKIIKTTLNKMSKFSDGTDLIEMKINKESQLENLKEIWRSNIIAKSHNQKLMNRRKNNVALGWSDPFIENRLLLKDYYESVERARENQKRENELQQIIADIVVKKVN